MTDYTKSTNFASKDSLPSGDPLKIVKGTEIDTEFNSIATAVATKADITTPTFLGTPAAPTAASGTSTTQIATTAFVDTYFAKKGANSDITALSGLTTALSVAQGGTGATSITSGSLVKGNGTSAMTAASAAEIVSAIGSTAVTNATTATNASNILGASSQAYTDVTSSRALGTQYTNSTGKPIMVVIWLGSGAVSQTDLSAVVNGVGPFIFGHNTNSGGGVGTTGSIVIPIGATYTITANNGSITSWYELR
jgi:hypothetical protein